MNTDTAVSTPHAWHVQYRDFSVIMLREDIVIRVAQGIHGSTNKW